ncbi:hypothetical protein JSY36_14710 [Bacillus sp. H-16]|uniref:hypothetical protein n=1 Tax=Alteribacter salitolerans TaxID=2912333 RepID=UPI00196635C1|nr:hypothetical protein [Alteribacter salitolerans]MBM7096985.1 hypothetical protein [Alteribacter salitolerans]
MEKKQRTTREKKVFWYSLITIFIAVVIANTFFQYEYSLSAMFMRALIMGLIGVAIFGFWSTVLKDKEMD